MKCYFFDRKLNINIVLYLKSPFLRFSRDFKAKLEILFFYFMKKVIFPVLYVYFDGPQLFFGGRPCLENARNEVFRSSRYGLKKIPKKNIHFSKSYRVRLLGVFFLQKSQMGSIYTSSSREAIQILSFLSQKCTQTGIS